jgi:hypothetical protein
MIQDACNYDPFAEFSDMSCIYPEQGLDCEGFFVGDINEDGGVNTQDILWFLGDYGTICDDPQNCPSDVDGDGTVTTSDLLLLLEEFGMTNAEGQAWMQQNLNCDYSQNFCIV